MKKKVKRYEEGGVVGNSNYPFGQSQAASTTPAPSIGLGNTSPLVQVNTPGAAVADQSQTGMPFGMKKGGAVKSSASSRGDGCAMRGKTKGRMV